MTDQPVTSSPSLGGRSRAIFDSALNEDERLARIVASGRDGTFSIDLDGMVNAWNAGASKIFGYAEAEMVGHSIATIVTSESVRFHEEAFARLRSGESMARVDGTAVTKGGKRVDVSCTACALRDARGVISGMAGFISDITDAKADMHRLLEGEQLYHDLIEQAPEAIVVYDYGTKTYIEANHSAELLFECEKAEIVSSGPGRFYAREQPDGAPTPESYEEHTRRAAGGELMVFERVIRGLKGKEWHCEVRLALLPSRDGHLIRATFVDITARKAVEESVLRINRVLQTMSSGNSALVHAASESDLLQQMCRILVDVGGYEAAWIALVASGDDERGFRPAAHAGSNDAAMPWLIGEPEWGPTGTAIRSGVSRVVSLRGLEATPWQIEAVKRGYVAAASFPLRGGNLVLGSLTIYSNREETLGPQEARLLEELAGDLSYGIVALHDRADRELALERLQENLEETVMAIARALEMRDPYTAGHQRRVATLSVAIGRKLGLSEDRLRGLHLAATIHDVGKINVPFEILSKPGALVPAEFALIRSHAQTGYEIIKGIRFPWAIGDIIVQHHERLDGSGYPNGLEGDAILTEARILAVADVVEAMTAHRPYRPSRGIQSALDEIERGKGQLYDPTAVEACAQLFQSEGFQFDYEAVWAG